MNVSEEQKVPLIILCCLVVLVLGFGAYRMMGTSTQAATKKVVKAEKKSESKVESQEPVSILSATVAENAGGAAKDPFAPRVAPKKAEPQQVKYSAGSRPLPLVAKVNTNQLSPVFPTFPLQPIGVDGNPVQEADPTQDLKLTGIVEGDVNVAIIRGSENSRYIVRQGQSIDGKYTVESVTKNGVCLKYEGKRFFLKLGGNDAVDDGTRA